MKRPAEYDFSPSARSAGGWRWRVCCLPPTPWRASMFPSRRRRSRGRSGLTTRPFPIRLSRTGSAPVPRGLRTWSRSLSGLAKDRAPRPWLPGFRGRGGGVDEPRRLVDQIGFQFRRTGHVGPNPPKRLGKVPMTRSAPGVASRPSPAPPGPSTPVAWASSKYRKASCLSAMAETAATSARSPSMPKTLSVTMNRGPFRFARAFSNSSKWSRSL